MQRYDADRPNHGLHLFVNFIADAPAINVDSHFSYDELAKVLAQTNIAGKRLVILLDSHTEGPSYNHVKPTVEKLNGLHGIQLGRMIHWTGSKPTGVEPINHLQNLCAFSMVTRISRLPEIRMPTHHFVMLGRIARKHRVDATVEVLRRGLDLYGKVSCGCVGDGAPTMDMAGIPDEFRHRFPLIVDGYVGSRSGNVHADDALAISDVTDAFCHVIGESSHENQIREWSMPFPTEKTEKCMLLGQVPMFNGPMGLAENIRELGFDLFDDIIDHSYDQVRDPKTRLGMVMDQLSRVCSEPIERLRIYKLDNMHRFERNRNLCFSIRRNLEDLHYAKLRSCLDLISSVEP